MPAKKKISSKASVKELKPKFNTNPKIPPTIEKSIKLRQKKSMLRERALREQNEAREDTKEEIVIRNRAITSILKKLNIYDEFLELEKLENNRNSRWLKALNK